MSGAHGDLWTQLSSLGRSRCYSPGTPIFVAGSRLTRVFVVRFGRVKVCITAETGRETVLAVRGPGDLIGELSALDGGPTSASAYPIEEVEVTVIPADEYRRWLLHRPDVLLDQMVTVIGRLRESDSRRMEQSAYDVDLRIARRLQELAVDHGRPGPDGSIELTARLSQEELGSYAGASREAAAHALRRLRDAGVIETSRRRLVILDPRTLQALAHPL